METTSWVSLAGAEPLQIPIDSNGNLTSKTEGSDAWTYTWNAENQLTKVEKNSVEQARFAYDPLGRRVEKVAGGVTTSYAYDKHDAIREVRGAAVLKYVHGPEMDEPLAVDDGTAFSYFHADGLGSIVKRSDAAGAVTLTRQYDAWGRLELGTNEPGYAFTGREWEPEIGLLQNRARYYDPGTARFVQEDPARFDGGVNFFAYVGNNPGTFFDPLGTKKRRRRYKTPDAAATAALQLCFGETQYTGWEFCGMICKVDGAFTFTPPKTDQDAGQCKLPKCPEGTTPAGDYHTHPPPPAGDEDFSFKDKWYVILDPTGNPSYMGSPTGKIRRFDKECRCTTTLPGNLK